MENNVCISYSGLVQASLVEKLRLKNNALRVRRRKLISQLKQKEEAGDVRNEVDFQQLKIENKQLVDKFDAKNQELLQLKLKSGNTTQVLNGYKVLTIGPHPLTQP